MKCYTIYNQEKIKGMITCTEETLFLNLSEGDMYIDGRYTDEHYCVLNGSILELPPKPSFPCFFNKSVFEWVWDEAASWDILRSERNRRLSACDWTQTADAPVDRAAWAAYRQALRDLPANTADPRNPQWPSPPA